MNIIIVEQQIVHFCEGLHPLLAEVWMSGGSFPGEKTTISNLRLCAYHTIVVGHCKFHVSLAPDKVEHTPP